MFLFSSNRTPGMKQPDGMLILLLWLFYPAFILLLNYLYSNSIPKSLKCLIFNTLGLGLDKYRRVDQKVCNYFNLHNKCQF